MLQEKTTTQRRSRDELGGAKAQRYQRRLLANVGHFPQREDPETVTHEIIMWLQENRDLARITHAQRKNYDTVSIEG